LKRKLSKPNAGGVWEFPCLSGRKFTGLLIIGETANLAEKEGGKLGYLWKVQGGEGGKT